MGRNKKSWKLTDMLRKVTEKLGEAPEAVVLEKWQMSTEIVFSTYVSLVVRERAVSLSAMMSNLVAKNLVLSLNPTNLPSVKTFASLDKLEEAHSVQTRAVKQKMGLARGACQNLQFD